MMLDLSDSINAELRSRVDERARYYLKSVRPIYGADSASRPDNLGSGILIQINDTHFLVTAAHVIDLNSQTTMYIGGYDRLIQLEGKCVVSSCQVDRKNDTYDIAVMKLSKKIVDNIGDCMFMMPHDMAPSETAKTGKVYMALGYPWRKNRYFDQRTKTKRLVPFVYSADAELDNSKYSDIGIENYSHILVNFNRKNTMDETGNRQTAPMPHGISGGGIWLLGDFSTPENYELGHGFEKLIGVLIEWKERQNYIMGIRIPFILEAVRRTYPELDPYIPKCKGYDVIIAPKFVK